MVTTVDNRPPHYPADWANTIGSVHFLEELRPGGPWTVSAIYPEGTAGPHADGDEGSSIVTATLSDSRKLRTWIAKRNGKANLHFQANRTKVITSKASKADITAAEYVHVEIDEDLEGNSLADPARKAAAVKRLRAIKQPGTPTFIIDSGGGVQALWRIDEVPSSLFETVEGYNLHLRRELGGDVGTHNIDRLLRLPGTVNVPGPTKRARGRVIAPATLIESNSKTYDSIFDFKSAVLPPKSVVVDSEFGDPEPVEDLDALAHEFGLPQKVVDVIRDGDPTMGDGSSSESCWYAVTRLVQHRVPNEIILGLLTDARYPGVYEHVEKNPRDDEDYAARLLRRALEARAAELASDFRDGIDPKWLEGVGTAHEEPERSRAPLESTYQESLKWTEPKWQVAGLLPYGGFAQCYGKQKTMKTFMMLDLALCVATGQSYHGHEVQRGKVTYVAAEGSRVRFRDRITAWLKHNAVDAAELDGWFFFVNRPVNLTDVRSVKAFNESLRDGPERHLVIFDTVAKNSGGQDEDTKGMKAFVNGANTVRFGTKAAVLVIHHEGKTAAFKSRGSTVLPGDVDISLRAVRMGRSTVKLVVDEARDIDSGATLVFQAHPVITWMQTGRKVCETNPCGVGRRWIRRRMNLFRPAIPPPQTVFD